MKRKIYNDLKRWKQDSAGRTALLIDGARRVGKSYIVEAFANAEYRSYISIEAKSGKNYTLSSIFPMFCIPEIGKKKRESCFCFFI